MKSEGVLLFILIGITAGCSSEPPKTRPVQAVYAGEEDAIEKVAPYYLELEIRQSCQAVIGERSSSCCREIAPFRLKVAVPKTIYTQFRIEDDLLNYDLRLLPYLDAMKKENLRSMTVVQSGRWDEAKQ
jgi:hypothetical protein